MLKQSPRILPVRFELQASCFDCNTIPSVPLLASSVALARMPGRSCCHEAQLKLCSINLAKRKDEPEIQDGGTWPQSSEATTNKLNKLRSRTSTRICWEVWSSSKCWFGQLLHSYFNFFTVGWHLSHDLHEYQLRATLNIAAVLCPLQCHCCSFFCEAQISPGPWYNSTLTSFPCTSASVGPQVADCGLWWHNKEEVRKDAKKRMESLDLQLRDKALPSGEGEF